MPRLAARNSLLVRFAVLSALVVLALILAFGAAIERLGERRALAQARRTARLIADTSAASSLTGGEIARGRLDPANAEHLTNVVKKGRREGLLAQVKVWDSSGRVLYSEDSSLVGEPFPITDALRVAFGGRIASDLETEADDEGNTGGRAHDDDGMLEAYVPLEVGGGPAVDAVFEVYIPYRPILATSRAEARSLQLIAGGGLLLLYLALFHIVARASRTQQEQARQNEWLAMHDSLTTLPNRTLLRDRLGVALRGARRTAGTTAVLLMDLDRFKEINDTLGHHHGDELLRQVSSRLTAVVRQGDTVARLGGDEFAVLLNGVADQQAASEVAVRILRVLQEPFSVEGMLLDIGASIGIALAPDHGDDPETLMQRADVAMYVAKDTNTGFATYAVEDDRYSAQRLAMVGELRRAIDGDELVLYYQPKVDVGKRDVRGVEALVRWRHPERGLVPPDQFIPLAEHTGLIKPLTVWVLDEALRQAAEWLAEGVPVTVAVNLSAKSLLDLELPNAVESLLAIHALPASALELEVTEGSLISDPARALAILERLNELGVRLSIDDFGTGYSSLSYLKRLPFDELKIDRSFVTNMVDDESDAAIVRATIELARNLGMSVVAEGVETSAAWEELAALGCDMVQGYVLTRPLPADDFETWYTTGYLQPAGTSARAAMPAVGRLSCDAPSEDQDRRDPGSGEQ